MLARLGRLYCRLATELPTQTRQLVVGDTGAAHAHEVNILDVVYETVVDLHRSLLSLQTGVFQVTRRQLGAAHYGAAQGAAQDDGGVARPCQSWSALQVPFDHS